MISSKTQSLLPQQCTLLAARLVVVARVSWCCTARYQNGEIWSSSSRTYGDMSMHLGFITSIAEQKTFRLCIPFAGRGFVSVLVGQHFFKPIFELVPLRLAHAADAFAGAQVFFKHIFSGNAGCVIK